MGFETDCDVVKTARVGSCSSSAHEEVEEEDSKDAEEEA